MGLFHFRIQETNKRKVYDPLVGYNENIGSEEMEE